MAKRSRLTNEAGEVRELTAADAKLFKPAGEALPPNLREKLGVRGPQKAPTKKPATVRYDADILEAFRATGPRWQSRMNSALRDWLKTHAAEEAPI
ncbi:MULTISPECIES: BrnA antitoxin family protein [unclassified Caballeronia]|uniref:BrnA antitoxin family protein n=1 Tax=unclassified Caballeronia TaxID=2646786 RepID=UPI0020287289|nr:MULTISPECIES: BrnA antitoxin family protein [unclassified Caballeronia]